MQSMTRRVGLLRFLKQSYLRYNLPGRGLARDVYLRLKHQQIGYRFYDRENAAIAQELHDELARVLAFRDDSEFWFYEVDFERRFAALCGKSYASGTASGTSALEFALRALGVGPGDEVIMPSHTFVATALAVSNVGARPVFVDIDEFATLDVRQVESAIGNKTRAVLPVHMHGNLCDMDALANLADRHRIALVEDCCQAFGSEWRGRQVPWGATGAFSFHHSKLLGGVGDGGMLVTNERRVKRQADVLKDPTANQASVLDSHRTPCDLDAVNVAVLNVKLRKVKEWLSVRRERAALNDQLLEPCKDRITLPRQRDGGRPNWYSYVIRTAQRDKLQRRLSQRRVATTVEHRVPIHLMATFAHLGYKEGSLPETERYCREALSLPISQWMTEEEVHRVAEVVRGAVKGL